MSKIRLFINETKLMAGKIIEITNNDFDYLFKVMRRKIGDRIFIFNGCDGEWQAQIKIIHKKAAQIELLEQEKRQYFPPKITLALAPVKNVRIDFVATKATELGISSFQPIITQNTIIDKINSERFLANCKEAAEQCRRLDLPQLQPIVKLEKFLNNIKSNQILILCDESGQGKGANEVLSKIDYDQQKNEIIILVGPEDGFSASEFERFAQIGNLYRLNLGPRILRADTAIISAITLVQEFLGDFALKANFGQ